MRYKSLTRVMFLVCQLAAQPSAGTGANPAWAPMVDELVQLRSRMASDSNRDPSIEARFVQVATEAVRCSDPCSRFCKGPPT